MNGRSCAVSTRVHSSSYSVPHPSLAPGTPVGTLHERREMIEVRAQPFTPYLAHFPQAMYQCNRNKVIQILKISLWLRVDL